MRKKFNFQLVRTHESNWQHIDLYTKVLIVVHQDLKSIAGRLQVGALLAKLGTDSCRQRSIPRKHGRFRRQCEPRVFWTPGCWRYIVLNDQTILHRTIVGSKDPESHQRPFLVASQGVPSFCSQLPRCSFFARCILERTSAILPVSWFITYSELLGARMWQTRMAKI